jgi:hypothetical protein
MPPLPVVSIHRRYIYGGRLEELRLQAQRSGDAEHVLDRGRLM